LSPSPLPTESVTPPGVTDTPLVSPALSSEVSRSPTPQVLNVLDAETKEETPDWASRLAPWALGLQVVALGLGVYVALRRPEK
jgi:hypothetical protein